MRIRVLAWFALACSWFPAATARATVAVMPLEAGAQTPPDVVAAAERGVVQGVGSGTPERILSPQEVAALGCALPVCVARAAQARFVVHMGVGSDNVLRADLYDARLDAVRTSDEQPLGEDPTQAAQAGVALGERMGAVAQAALAQEAGAQAGAAPPPEATGTAAPKQPKPPKGITDAEHPANSDDAAIAWNWLLSTMATFGGCACLSYAGSVASAACVAVLGFLVCSTPGPVSLSSGEDSWVLCLLPCMPPVLGVMGCALTLVTLGTPVVFVWRRVARWFSPAKAAAPDAAATAALPMRGLWMPAGFDRLEE